MTDPQHIELSPDELALRRAAEFGPRVVAFMDSEIGKYLIHRAEQERADTLDEMARADASNVEAMRELQLIVRRCDSFGQWLADAVMDGECAEEILKNGDA